MLNLSLSKAASPHRAVNIGDFIAFFGPLHPVHILLRPLLTTEQVECEANKLAGIGVLVRADVSDEQWAAVMQILRQGLGQMRPIPKTILRIYEKRTGKGWVRV